MNINVSLPDELGEQFKTWCDKNGHKMSSLIQHLIRMKMNWESEKVEGNSSGRVVIPITNTPNGGGFVKDGFELAMTKKPFIPDDAPKSEYEEGFIAGEVEEPPVSRFGPCFSCKRNSTVKKTTFLGEDQIRVTEDLCISCLAKARNDGVIRDD